MSDQRKGTRPWPRLDRRRARLEKGRMFVQNRMHTTMYAWRDWGEISESIDGSCGRFRLVVVVVLFDWTTCCLIDGLVVVVVGRSV